MKRLNAWVAAGLIVAVAQLTGCGKKESIYKLIPPANVTEIEGKEVKKVELLTDLAIERLDLQLAVVVRE